MTQLDLLHKELPYSAFFNAQTHSVNCANLNIKMDSISFHLSGNEGRMACNIMADEHGLKLTKEVLDDIKSINHFPYVNQYKVNNEPCLIFIQDQDDLDIVKYCLENTLNYLRTKQTEGSLESHIVKQVQFEQSEVM